MELLPAKLNPIQAGISVSPIIKEAINNFDALDSSKRHYDWVSPLDGLTMGMGHWPQSRASRFFLDMQSDAPAMEAFYHWAWEYFQVRPTKWMQLKRRISSRYRSLKLEKDSMPIAIEQSLLSRKFMSRYRKNRVHSLYKDEPWFPDLMRLVLRDKAVVEWQITFFEKSLWRPVMEEAESIGVTSIAGILALGSMKSSASSWSKNFCKTIAAKKKISCKGNKWYWDKHPFIESPTEEQWQSWYAVVMAQWYMTKKGKIRNRTYKLFIEHLAQEWDFGGLPTNLSRVSSRYKRNSRYWDPDRLSWRLEV